MRTFQAQSDADARTRGSGQSTMRSIDELLLDETPVHNLFMSPHEIVMQQEILLDEFPSRPDALPSMKVLIGICLPNLAIQMTWAALWGALNSALNQFLSPVMVVAAQLTVPLAGVFVAPTVGTLSDQCTSSLGRRKPFIIIGCIGCIVSWVALGLFWFLGPKSWFEPETKVTLSILATLFYMSISISLNAMETPARLLISDFVGTSQTTGSIITLAVKAVGSIIVALYIEIFGMVYNTFAFFVVMLIGVMLLSLVAVIVLVAEKPLVVYEKEKISVYSSLGQSVRLIFNGFFSLPPRLRRFSLVLFCVQFGYMSYLSIKGQFFGVEVFQGDSKDADNCHFHGNCTIAQENYTTGVVWAIGTTDLCFTIVGFICSILLPSILNRFGLIFTLRLSLIPQCIFIALSFAQYRYFSVVVVVLSAITHASIEAAVLPIVLFVVTDEAYNRRYNIVPNMGEYLGTLHGIVCLGHLTSLVVSGALIYTTTEYGFPILVGGILSTIGLLLSFSLVLA